MSHEKTIPISKVSRRRTAALLLILVASSALSIALLALRISHVGNRTYIFLGWNLFLAWIPFLCAAAAFLVQGRSRAPRLVILPLLALWLVFLPNAPYIITDFIHFRTIDGFPFWYDMFMLVTFAWNGLMLGFVSLWMVQAIVQRWFGEFAGWSASLFCLVACALGIYIGRFERLNSWDLLIQPGPLFQSIYHTVIYPLQHVRAISIVAMLAAMLCMMYVSLALFAAEARGEN